MGQRIKIRKLWMFQSDFIDMFWPDIHPYICIQTSVLYIIVLHIWPSTILSLFAVYGIFRCLLDVVEEFETALKLVTLHSCTIMTLKSLKITLLQPQPYMSQTCKICTLIRLFSYPVVWFYYPTLTFSDDYLCMFGWCLGIQSTI